MNDINTSDIRIKKPFVLYRQYEFDIMYGKNDYQFLIQTPICMLYKNIICDSNIIVIDISCNNDVFIKKLHDIITCLKEKIERCVPSILKGKTFVSPLKDNILRLKSCRNEETYVFDAQNDITELEKISRHDKLVFIFQCEKILVFDDWYSIYFRVVQIKKVGSPCISSIPLFKQISNESIPGTCTQTPSLPEKYQKMLDMGIPRPAVEQRMKMDGYTTISINNSTSPTLPEKYQKMLDMGIPRPAVEQRMKMDGILQISNVQLKKVDINMKMTTGKKEIHSKKGQVAPTLEEITNALKNLRSAK